MVPSEVLGSFAVTSLLIELTPGPNMAYLAVLSAGHGRRAGLAATVGIALGLSIVGLAAALGLSTLILASPFAYELLRWGGVAYLLWLSWDGWRDATETSPARTGVAGSSRGFLLNGLATNLLNPKAAVFYIAVLPRFIGAGGSVLGQTVTLTLIYVLIATAVHAAIVGLAGTTRAFLEDPKRSRRVRRALSLALAAVALWLAYSTAR